MFIELCKQLKIKQFLLRILFQFKT
jgi:hypothetical protein